MGELHLVKDYQHHADMQI